jgi:hypothetical protein
MSNIKYVKVGNHVEGILQNCSIFLIDEEDYEKIKEYAWWLKRGYAFNTELGLMHRFLMKDQLSKGLEIDHIDRNRLNNCKDNLRVVTRQENMHNKSIYKTNTSGHIGVKWNTKLSKWVAQITKNKKRIHLGVFDNLQDAIMARRIAEQ